MNITDEHIDYTKNKPIWEQLQACVDGQQTIKRAAERYLPYPIALTSAERQTEAFQEDYNIYLNSALFVEYTQEVVNDLIGVTFRKDPQIEPTPPSALEYFDYQEVCKRLTAEVITYGRAFIFCDYPDNPNQDAVAYTETYPALSVINWEVTRYMGTNRLTRVVLKEESTEEYQVYRELLIEEDLFVVNIYHDEEFQEQFQPTASGSRLTEIPGTFVGSMNNDPIVDKSTIAGISNSNIKHYQIWAELSSTITYLGHPQLVVTGLPAGFNKKMKEDNTNLQVGSGKTLTIEGGETKVDLVEIKANTIHFDTLEKIEQSIQDQNGRIKSQSYKSAGVESAAALKIKQDSEHSTLSSLLTNVEDAMEQVYIWLGMFMGVSTDITFFLNRDFFASGVDPTILSALSSAEISDTVPAGTTTQYLIDSELLTFEDEEAVIDEIKNGQSDTGPLPGSSPRVEPIKPK